MAESTQRFNGRTLEDAIGKATDALGSGAEILEAKRVRRGGVFGKLQNESFEVVARARAGAGRAGAARAASSRSRPATFDHALRDMIDEVDLREERQLDGDAARQLDAESVWQSADGSSRRLLQTPARRVARGCRFASAVRRFERGAPAVGNRFTDDDLVPLPASARAPKPARPAAARPAEPRRAAPVPATSPARMPAMAAGAAAKAAGTLPPPPAGASAPVAGASTIDLREQRGTGPKWSTQGLRDLGVPEAILELMPTASLDSDVSWTVALEAAIRARMPLTPTVPLAVHGYGDNAAVQMLEATLNGYAIGDLHLLDRVVPATAFELTLAIRGMFVALKHRFLAMVAMALLGVIAFNMVRGELAIDEAATRVFVLVVVAAVVDRMVMPIVLLVVGIEQKAAPTTGSAKKAKKKKQDDDEDEDESSEGELADA